MSRDDDPDWDMDRNRLNRIEQKLDIFAGMVAVVIGLGAAAGAERLLTKTLDLPDWVGGIGAFIAFGVVGGFFNHNWRKI